MERSDEPLAYSLDQVPAVVPIGRTKLYAEIGAGKLRTVKIGRRTLILRADLIAWLDAQSDRAAVG